MISLLSIGFSLVQVTSPFNDFERGEGAILESVPNITIWTDVFGYDKDEKRSVKVRTEDEASKLCDEKLKATETDLIKKGSRILKVVSCKKEIPLPPPFGEGVEPSSIRFSGQVFIAP